MPSIPPAIAIAYVEVSRRRGTCGFAPELQPELHSTPEQGPTLTNDVWKLFIWCFPKHCAALLDQRYGSEDGAGELSRNASGRVRGERSVHLVVTGVDDGPQRATENSLSVV